LASTHSLKLKGTVKTAALCLQKSSNTIVDYFYGVLLLFYF
jgi:hypothetical protein